MPNRSMRSFLATLVVMGSALPGLVGGSASAAPAETVVPTGGCWRYVPGALVTPETPVDDIDGMADISTALEPWAVDPRLALATAGDTAVGGVRTFALDIAGGPSVDSSPLAVDGTATYFFDVVDPKAQRTALDPIVVDFKIQAETESIPAMRAEGAFPIALAGTSALILRAVYFDLPFAGERLACNGQSTGLPTGPLIVDTVPGINPATTPVDTSVMASVTSVQATKFAVTQVVGQKVVNAARPGDEVQLALSGFASEVQVALGFCGPSAAGAPTCGQTGDVTTLADGSSTKSIVVPDSAVIGVGSARARARGGVADVVLDQPMRVLGAPVVELAKTAGRNRVRAVGAEWNPLQQVRIRAVDDAGDRVGKTVKVDAGPTGRIDARLTVSASADAVAIVAEQQHRGTTLEATVDLPVSATGGGGDNADSNAGSNAGSDAGSTPSAAPAAAAPVLPLDIPAPVDLPVTTVSDPQPAGAASIVDALAVTKVKLKGSTRLADLFGRGPDRVLTLQVENVSAADVIAPGLTIGVGKGDDADPVYASDGFGRLKPGESLKVEVPIGLPAGAFGVYTVSGQIGEGDAGSFAIAWEAYPWGLFGLNGLGILLIAFAIRRRVGAPAPSRVAALVGAPGAAVATSGSDEGAAVIDLAVLERWWALQAADGAARETVDADAMADAVVDVEAVERWLERRSARGSQIR